MVIPSFVFEMRVGCVLFIGLFCAVAVSAEAWGENGNIKHIGKDFYQSLDAHPGPWIVVL